MQRDSRHLERRRWHPVGRQGAVAAAGCVPAISQSPAVCGGGSEGSSVANLGSRGATTAHSESGSAGASRSDAPPVAVAIRETLNATPQNGLGPDSPRIKAVTEAVSSPVLEAEKAPAHRLSEFGGRRSGGRRGRRALAPMAILLVLAALVQVTAAGHAAGERVMVPGE
ncbi:MAG TPA: hypothetical protein VJL81_04860 [Solirubrobacterales bacterium]|nr:hypothetical protein [Solirubrobacterales bacterium]